MTTARRRASPPTAASTSRARTRRAARSKARRSRSGTAATTRRSSCDFQSSHTESGALEGATLTLWDSRYDTAKLLPQAVLYTDGDAWEMVAAVKQSPAPGETNAGKFQTENKLFVELPRASLKAIRNAETVRFRFYYEGGQTIDLPLNAPDLEYWKAQLQ